LKPEEAGFSWAKHVRRMTEKQFKLRYRLTFDAFMELLDKMGLRAYLNPSTRIVEAMFESSAKCFAHLGGSWKSWEVESYIPSPGSPFSFFPASPKYSSMGTPNTA
jgi:hypothetical protein